MRIFFKNAAVFATGMALIMQPAQACWDNAAQNAAKISNLNMMLMVTALRCRGGSDNFLAQYNDFVKTNNALLGSQNSIIRSQFAKTVGLKAAETALDKLTTGYANTYGAGHPYMGCHELKTMMSEVANEQQDVASLSAIADRAGGGASIPDENCPTSFASRK